MERPKSKQRALGLLIVLGSVLVLIASWNFPENLPKKVVDMSGSPD
jgi:hypothetical protein